MNGVRGTRGRKKSTFYETHDKSTTQLVFEAGKYRECYDIADDQSLTKQQRLRLFGQTLLIKGNPFGNSAVFVRETSKTHRRKVEID